MKAETNSPFLFSLLFLSLITTIILFLPILTLIFSTSPNQYIEGITDSEVMTAIFLSILTASVTTLLANFLGIPVAYLLVRKDFPLRETVESFIDLPILIPHTVAGIALLTVFGPRAPLGSLTRTIGINFTSTVFGIILAQFFVSAPLLINTVKEVLAKIDEGYLKAARSLGATPFNVFRDIELPLIKKGILTGSILCWARALSEFGAVIILAYYPYTAPVLVYIRFETQGLSAALSISALLLVITLFIFSILKYVQRRESAND
ncbi:MAG: ABC transporter permease [Candidatus Njordarchaeia archaeon]